MRSAVRYFTMQGDVVLLAHVNLAARQLTLCSQRLFPYVRSILGRSEGVSGLKCQLIEALLPGGKLSFKEGGRPRNRQDLNELEFSVEDAVDPTRPRGDGTYEPLTEEQKDKLYNLALRY